LTSKIDRLRAPVTALVLVLPALLVGLVVGAQFQTQSGRTLATARYLTPLIESAAQMQTDQADLKTQLAALRVQLDDIQQNAVTLDTRTAAIQTELLALKAAAGLTALSGAGVTITLDDGRVRASSSVSTIELAIVHSSDITDVVNASWKAGATAISINGERITGSSACVGAVIQINGTLLSPPFVVSVLGPSDALLRTLNDPRELSDQKRRHDAFGLGFHIERSDQLRVPGYAGPISVRYAALP
jgi:uncharacterized protein YlxW (UPF0749 family)